MSDIKFNCPTCTQPLEAPPEMAGQLIECPKCKKSLEIPSLPHPAPEVSPKPIIARNTVAKPLSGKKVLIRGIPAIPSSVPGPSPKNGSPVLKVALFFLALACVALAGGMFYLLKNRSVGITATTGTPVAPTKENAILARQTAERETLVERVLPDITVDGEVFIVTKGGQSIKLGLVEVVLIPMQTLLPHLDSIHARLTNELASLEQELKTAEEEKIRLGKERDSSSQKWMDAMRSDYGTSHQAKETYDRANDVAEAALSKWLKLLQEKIELMSGSVYFDSMPSPLRETKTNSDGRFRLLAPGSGSFAVAAIASRNVGDEVERYYWLLKIDPSAGANQSIMLSNDNLMSSGIVEVFIETR